MAERLAALGIKAPAKAGETPQQRAEREKREREEKLRQAEEEDARREEERQRRLNDESAAPPAPVKGSGKKPAPPPPASRKNKTEVAQHDVQQAEAEAKRAENDMAEKALRDQQEAQEAETKHMEYVQTSNSLRLLLISTIGKKNRDKRTIWPKSARLLKLDSAHLKSRCNKASSRRRRKRSVGQPLRRSRRNRKVDSLHSALKLKPPVSVSDSYSCSLRHWMMTTHLMMKVLRTLPHKTPLLRPARSYHETRHLHLHHQCLFTKTHRRHRSPARQRLR
jgi:hypothetical protein